MVLRRAVPRRLPGAAPAARARLPRARPPGLVRHRRLRPRPRTTGRASGPRPTCSSRRGRSGPGSRSRASASSRWSAGPSAAATRATGPGNSVPRFHIVWGTGPGRRRAVRRAGCGPPSTPAWSSCASGTGSPSWSSPTARSPASGARSSSPAASPAGEASSRTEVGDFEIAAQAVVVTSGGHRRQPRPGAQATGRPGSARRRGGCSPASRRTSTGAMLQATEAAGASVVNGDRMWHYTEGIANHSPVWANHGIRILPGPSSLWLDADRPAAARAAVPRLRHPRHARPHRADRPRAHLVHRHAEDRREGVRALRAPSRTPTSPARTCKLLLGRARAGVAGAGAGLPRPGRGLRRGATTLPELVAGMNRITGGTPELDLADVEREVVARDREIAQPVHQGPADHRHPRRPQLPRRQADPGRRRRTGCSTPRPAR